MKRVNLFFLAILIPLDYLMFVGSAAIAYSLRFSPIFAKIRPVTFDLPFDAYMKAVLPMALVWVLIFALLGLYSSRQSRIAVETSRIILAISAGIGVILAIAFFSRELFDSRFIVLAVWILSTILVVLERVLVRLAQRSLRKIGVGLRYVIIVGKTKSGNDLKKFFDHYPKFGYAVSAHVGEFSDASKKEILQLKKKEQADILLVANPEMSRIDIQSIKTFSDIEHMTFIYSAEMFPGSVARPVFHTFAGQPVIEVPQTPLDGWGAIYKRLFDIVVSLLLIVLSLPIQIIVAIAILVDNPGRILFFQKRVGQGGKPFTYFKFRSMVKDAHKYHFDEEFIKKFGNVRKGPFVKLAHDPRVTRVGHFIRKFSIDEVPEFYNVFFGKMSLVGPRPHMPGEVEKYRPSQRKVLTIKPGITGMAQIGGRGNLDHDEEVRLDMHYIENWSPWLDLVILLKTPFAVFEKLDSNH